MIVALIGLIASFAAISIAFPKSGRRRSDVFAAILAMHLAATVGYFLLAEEAGYDAMFYYNDPLGWADGPVRTGTFMIIYFVQGLKSLFGGSFFAYFLFFQAFGMIGFALLCRSFEEIADSLNVIVPFPLYGLLMLPGMHLWTSAIGKDGLLFLAASLSVWASLRISRRLVWMALALLVMALIRPPVAAVAIISLAATLLFDKRLALGPKIAVWSAVVTALGIVLSTAQNHLEIQSLDPQGISDFVERNKTIGQMVAGGADIVGMPYPAKLFSLLFRPLFFDARSALSLIASTENLLLLCLFGYLAVHSRMLAKLIPVVFCMSYSLVFSSTIFITLALVNYNVGLGLRQKMMGMPGVLILVAGLVLYRRHLVVRAERSRSAEKARLATP